jgi:hypothetical protein
MTQLFNHDFAKLKHLNLTTQMSKELSEEVIKDHASRYEELYPYFWRLIDENISQCQKCVEIQCYNREFLKKLKDQLNRNEIDRNDLYLMTYMTTYFLDLIRSRGHTLLEAYYILSKGHDYVIKYVLGSQPKLTLNPIEIENYQGYLLSVLYYLLPDFKYILPQ